MLSCDLHDLLQDLLGINCSCRVIRINDNNRFGLVCDLALNIINVRIPFRLLITNIMNYISTCQSRSSCPQRIIRCRDQNLIPVIQKCLHTEIDQLTDTITCINITHGNPGNSSKLGILHNGLSCGKDSFGIGISLRGTNIAQHVQNYFLRCRKSKWIWIADIQLQNLHSILFHSGRFIHYRSSHIIKYVIQFTGLLECFHLFHSSSYYLCPAYLSFSCSGIMYFLLSIISYLAHFRKP